jgi:hypothetical protein
VSDFVAAALDERRFAVAALGASKRILPSRFV